MVQDAEASKDADAARRIMIDLKNEADQATYNTEKQIQEHSAKIPQNIKDQINGDITALNEAITTEEVEKIKEALERWKNSSMEIGKAIYAQTDSSTDSTDSSEPPKDEGEEKKDEEKKDEEKKWEIHINI